MKQSPNPCPRPNPIPSSHSLCCRRRRRITNRVTHGAGPAKLQVVLVPGNPGSVLFFKTFLTHAHRLLGGQADIIGVTHAGHAGAATDHGGKVLGAQEEEEGAGTTLLRTFSFVKLLS